MQLQHLLLADLSKYQAHRLQVPVQLQFRQQ